MFDSVLYRDVFSTPAMRAVFSDEAQLRAYVQAEVALAMAQGETSVIPQEAAQAIARQAPAITLDSEQLKRDTENVGYPIVGLVRQLSAQLGGAAGTLASLGERGLDVRAAYARVLGLAEPDITWHVARDGLVELVQTLAVICGALGKIGYDVMILMATEIGEVFEPFASHRGASSTMPQKRNPISSEILLANAKISRQAASLMLDAMVQDLERATAPWHCQWL